ncbi:MAG: class I SAM-dependent methyltransferase [Opitutaceae bacterium]|jgi:SAM-dependent methyltransferase|nr:class I SAM-dependent methyltransferase [Opitutaceae bacterium]
MFQVFEHLTEPRKALERARDMLKPDGRLIISFPNILSMQAKMFGPKWLHLDPPRHLFLMPENAFIKTVQDLGFSVERQPCFSLKPNPYGLMGFTQSTLNTLLAKRNVLYERLKGNKAYAPSYGSVALVLQLAATAVLVFPALILTVIESACRRGATVEYVLRKR